MGRPSEIYPEHKLKTLVSLTHNFIDKHVSYCGRNGPIICLQPVLAILLPLLAFCNRL